jgi:hypothetical protein
MNIKVILVEPDKEPSVIEIKHSLKTFQDIVEGYIDILEIDENVDIILNDEGKLLGLPFNRFIFGDNDIVAGTFIIVGNNKGETISLNESQIKKCLDNFSLQKHKDKIENYLFNLTYKNLQYFL